MDGNREQRRKAEKLARKKRNINQNKKNPLIKKLMKETEEHSLDEFHGGEIVELDVDNIIQNVSFDRLQPEYQEFVRNARGRKFHVLKVKNMKKLVCLFEDPTRPRWLFWTGYLKRVVK